MSADYYAESPERYTAGLWLCWASVNEAARQAWPSEVQRLLDEHMVAPGRHHPAGFGVSITPVQAAEWVLGRWARLGDKSRFDLDDPEMLLLAATSCELFRLVGPFLQDPAEAWRPGP